ncbi:MAG: hypothetical protein C0598_06015 [Marinilabiliales bacterium]|nr:MAG: hypothetical protein C0598_06015 [Marinilabiliales bacterium]
MISKLKQQYSELNKRLNLLVIKRTILIFVPIISLIIITTTIIINTQEKLELQVYKDSENSVVETKLKNVETEISHIISEMFVLKLNSRISEICNTNDEKAFQNVENDILNLVKFQKSYDQVRIINKHGNEIIRVNYNSGNPYIVRKDQLQNKKDRYYFSETCKLEKNEIFVSPFDLNVENKQLEIPLKPMIRFATPLYNINNERSGILVFNYFGQIILDQLNTYINTVLENQLMLLNSDGYWLKGPDSEKEWGFMYDNKKHYKFSRKFPHEWKIIKQNESSQIITDNGLFTFKTIYPINKKAFKEFHTDNYNLSSSNNKRMWKLISFVPHEILYHKQFKRRKFVTVGIIIFALGLLFVSWKLAVYQYKIKKTLLSLQISNHTKDKFFTIIAHDLKGPFNALLGFSDVLVGEIEMGDNANVKTYSLILKDTIHNTYNFLINLLDWSRSQTNKIDYKPEKFNLYNLVEEIILLLNLQAETKKISINNKISHHQEIFADKNMINTVIRNFISNAIKYTNLEGKVEISSSILNNKITCSVTDNGIGMNEEVLTEIRNFGDTISTPGTEDEKGTGLGLILCNELIKKHKGKINIKSKEGEGSTFCFEIPQ